MIEEPDTATMVKNSFEGIMGRNLSKKAESSSSVIRQSTDEVWLLSDLFETIALGKSLIEWFPTMRILLLDGPLGAGKTSLVKGLASGLNIKEPITSPTFALSQHYMTGHRPLIHIDLYRLEEKNEANNLFLQEEEEAIMLDSLLVIEWPERLSIDLQEAWRLSLKYESTGGRLAQLIIPNKNLRIDLPDS